jgi:hypothetical protein
MSPLSTAVRFACLVLAGAAYAHSVVSFDRTVLDVPAWKYLGASLLLSVAWQWRIPPLRPSVVPSAVVPGARWRIAVGIVLAVGGAAFFCWASLQLHRNWAGNFDVAWLTWVGSAATMAIGLDLAWGRWPRPSGLWSGADVAVVAGLFAADAALRAWGLVEFPGPYHVSQIEVAQVGNFGHQFLDGMRVRWEYLSHMWLSAVGQALFTNDLPSVRVPFAVVNALKLIPFYFALRWLVGRPGAVVGAALLACSGWDAMLSRIPTNQNELTAAVALALLAGPARRGRPSAYVFLGLIGGYVAYEYIAYRPLALFVVLGAGWLSLRDGSVGWPRRLLRPVVTLALVAAMAAPLFTAKLTSQVGYQYLDGWNRARGQEYYTKPADLWESVDRRLQRARVAFGSFVFRGDSAVVRNLDRRPALDRVTAAFVVAGIAFALSHWMAGLVPLSLFAFLVTFSGTLIATGNFDMARAGCNVIYIHTMAGYGAAGFASLLRGVFGGAAVGAGRIGVAAVLAICVAVAADSNLRFLTRYWRSPDVREASHLELAYQTRWLSDTVRPGEYVVGLSVRAFNVLMGNDASWMRASHVEGTVAADLWSMIEEIEKYRGRDLFLYVSAEGASALTVDLLESVWPQLRFDYAPHPLREIEGVYFGRLAKSESLAPDPPSLRAVRCRSARGEFVIHFKDAEARRFPTLFPFIDRATWPQIVRWSLYHGPERAENVSLHIRVPFAVEKPGNYTFRVRAREGRPTMSLGRGLETPTSLADQLSAGVHELELKGDFLPTSAEPEVRLEWRGPDTNHKPELMPIFKIAPPHADCAGAFPDDFTTETQRHGEGVSPREESSHREDEGAIN